MLSQYFKMQVKTEKFDNDLRWTIGEIKDKKVLVYGAGEAFVELNKKYNFTQELNIVAIADKKFENETSFNGLRAINPESMEIEDFDVILISNENYMPIISYLEDSFDLANKEIKTIFHQEIVDESVNFNYLKQFNFGKHLAKLTKKLQNKTVVIYGSGAFFEVIKKFYDLNGLNIIGIADNRFRGHDENQTFMDYTVYSPSELKSLNPDYVLVATKFYINIIEDLYYNTLKGTKIKIKPLLKKSFFTLLKEIWK